MVDIFGGGQAGGWPDVVVGTSSDIPKLVTVRCHQLLIDREQASNTPWHSNKKNTRTPYGVHVTNPTMPLLLYSTLHLHRPFQAVLIEPLATYHSLGICLAHVG